MPSSASEYYDPEFAGYVDGRTVAVVGPAPSVGDQAAEVDAHDLVYRASPQLGIPAGYGTRCDIGYINSSASAMMRNGQWDDTFRRLDWLVTKRRTRSEVVRHRRALLPPRGNANQVTGMLWDLAQYAPAAVTVFGTTFYTGDDLYDPAYENADAPRDTHAPGVRLHDQRLQRQQILDVRRRKGWPTGDARFDRLLDMDDDAFEVLLAPWYQPRQTIREYARHTR